MELGCVCQVKPEVRNRDMHQPFALNELEMRTTSQEHYLVTKPKFVYVYFSSFQSKGTFCLYISQLQKCYIVFLAPHEQEPMGNVTSAINDIKNVQELGITFEIYRETTLARATGKVQTILSEYKLQHPGPTVILTQSTLPWNALRDALPLLNEFPRINILANERDNQYPIFGWFSYAAQIAVQRAVQIPRYYDQAITMSRYANIPVGQWTGDVLHYCDILFARRLKQADHVLWFSLGPSPDLGGNEDYDPILLEEITNPEIVRPACVETIAIEIEVSALPLTTIMESSQIPLNELENLNWNTDVISHESSSESSTKPNKIDSGTTGNTPEETKTLAPRAVYFYGYDESVACLRVFKILKNLVTNWAIDVFPSEKEYRYEPDAFVRNFYRWLCSPESRLYDPALHHFVHKLVKKVFVQFLTELKNLGAKIVYASFNKVIIATNKKKLSEAKAYFNFLRETLAERPLLKYVHLDAASVRFWDILLFKDKTNFIGIPASDVPPDVKELAPISSFNVLQFMPSAIEKGFLVFVYDFILQLYKRKYKMIENNNPQTKDKEKDKDQLSTNKNLDNREPILVPTFDFISEKWDEEKEEIPEEDKEVLAYLSQKIFDFIINYQRTSLLSESEGNNEKSKDQEESLTSEERALLLPTDFNPLLEFVKVICYIFSLKKTLQNRVITLKRNLMKLIQVKEFSPEAEWNEPTTSYVLYNVICNFCCNERDIDLLKDPWVSKHNWKCPIKSCQHSYNKTYIEDRLVNIIQKRSISFQTQDLICEKCRLPKVDTNSLRCSNCSGSFVLRVSDREFKQGVTVFLKIAKFHHFKKLQETCEFLLK
jgi:DNA polymerase epsilon subunit 1